MFEILEYITVEGKSVYRSWLDGLRDEHAITRIIRRLQRLEQGNFGDCKPVGNGVWELRIDYGPGYRVYYSLIGKTVVLLLCGGDKRKQPQDIEKAIAYINDYKRRML